MPDAPRDHYALRCVLPPRWQQIDHAVFVVIVDETAKKGGVAATALNGLRTSMTRDGVILTALRARTGGDVFDFLLVAMPAASEGLRADAEPSRDATEIVELANGAAVLHPVTGEPTSASPLPASVQVVLRVPPSKRGAIVTVLSTEAGCEAMLAREAEAIAGSLRIEPTDE